MKSTMTRRDFLKMSGLGAAGTMLTLALASCAKENAPQNTPNQPANTPAGSEPAKSTVDKITDMDNAMAGTSSSEGRGESETGSVAGKDGKRTLLNFCANKVKDLNPFAQRVPAAPIAVLYMKLAYADGNGGCATDCCESIEQLDYTSYRVKLYDNIIDQMGNQFTAKDLAFCMNSRAEAGFSSDFNQTFQDIVVEDDLTAVIHVKSESWSQFLDMCGNAFLVTQASFEASGDNMSSNPIGFTQYKFVEMVPSSYVDFERVDEYWQTDKTKITRHYEANVDYIHYIMLTEGSQIIAGLQTGDIHLASGINYTNMKLLADDDKYSVFPAYQSSSMKELAFNMTQESICGRDINLRKAIFHCIDRDSLGQAFGGYQVLHALVPSLYRGYNTAWDSSEYFEYDLKKAEEYLKESTYKGETLRFLTNPGNDMTLMSEVLIACMSAIGIKCEPVTFEQATYNDAQFASNQEYDICIHEVGSNSEDIYDAFAKVGSDSFSNVPGTTKYGWDNQELIDLCNNIGKHDGRSEESRDRIQEIVNENAVLLGMVMTLQYVVSVSSITDIYANRGIVIPSASYFDESYEYYV